MKKTRLLLLAILSGIITTGIFYLYSTQAETVSSNVESEPVEMVEIVVATTDILMDQELTEELISIKQVEKDRVHAKALTKIDDVLGKFATTNISADEPILEHRVRDKEDDTNILSRKISEDLRAVSVNVPYAETVSNLVVAGDYVDVILTEVIEEEEETGIKTEIVLEKIKVLAIGERITDNTPKGIDEAYATVTLEISKGEIVKLVQSQHRGTIHLALHSKLNSEEKE